MRQGCDIYKICVLLDKSSHGDQVQSHCVHPLNPRTSNHISHRGPSSQYTCHPLKSQRLHMGTAPSLMPSHSESCFRQPEPRLSGRGSLRVTHRGLCALAALSCTWSRTLPRNLQLWGWEQWAGGRATLVAHVPSTTGVI